MKKLFFTFFFLLLFFNFSIAQSKFRFTIGPTISYFLNAENSSPKIGLAIGFRKDFHLYKRLALSTGVNFASRGAILENRTIAPYSGEPSEEAFYWDIHGMIGYLEFPIVIQYAIQVTQKAKLIPLLGPVLSIPIKDLSHFEKKEFFNIYIRGQSNPIDYDFNFGPESVFLNNYLKIPFTFGFHVVYKKLDFEIRYILDNRETYHFDSLSEVHYKIHSLYFLVSF